MDGLDCEIASAVGRARLNAAKILNVALPFESMSLHSKRIVITRAHEQAKELAEKIRGRGGEPIEFPTIALAPLDDFRALDDALAHVTEYDWIVFTSANGVRAVMARVGETHSSSVDWKALRVAAIGPGTARALEANGVPVAFIPTQFLGQQIARDLPIESGQRALLLRADLASDVLATGLTARGVQVSDVDAYRTVMPESREIDLTRMDAVTFTSSWTVRNFVAMLDDAGRTRLETLDLFCIGPVTAQTARELGLHVAAVAAEHTLDGLVEAMENYYGMKK
jgi:uroporphyrinogen III methyltransferase/synthase